MSNKAPGQSHWVDAAEDILFFIEGPEALAEAQKTMNDFASQNTGSLQSNAATPFRRKLVSSATIREDALAYLRQKPTWWSDLLQAEYDSTDGHKRKLLIAIRDGYMNAYADGQSVLRIEFKKLDGDVKPHCKIHHKYVDLPKNDSDYVIFNCENIVGPLGSNPIPYLGLATMNKWISAALKYRGGGRRSALPSLRHSMTTLLMSKWVSLPMMS
jgi:hypothetical protein